MVRQMPQGFGADITMLLRGYGMNIFHLPSTSHWDGTIDRIFGRLSGSVKNWFAKLPPWKGKR
jgi:hypothetical protein